MHKFAILLNKRPILIVLLLTLLALAESTVVPWAPLILLYAILCIIIPVVSGSCYFGSFKKALTAHWRLLLACLALLTLWDQAIMRIFFSLRTDLPIFISASRMKLHANALEAKITFAFFILVWAPAGEELLYRGYLQGNLRKRMPFIKALLIAASFFAVRHGLHLLFLYHYLPLSDSLVWAFLAFGWGIILGWLYEKSSSLYLTIAAHFLANCLSLVFD